MLASLALLLALQAAVDSAELEARLESLRGDIGRIQSELDSARQHRDLELDALAEADRQVSQATRELRQTRLALDETGRQIANLEQRRERLLESIAKAGHALGRQLLTAYTQRGQSRLKLLLDQDDPRLFSRRLAYHGYITRARLQVLTDLEQSLAELAENARVLASEQQELEQLEQQQVADVERLEAAREERGRALAVIETRIRSGEEELAVLQESVAELEELLGQLSTALADIPPDIQAPALAELRGQLPWPLSGPVQRRYGQQRRGEVNWSGILIGSDPGLDVMAIAHGRIAYADWLRGYGLILIIDHGHGFMSLYAHNESLLADVGDWVNPGQVIATVGNTGGVDEPGLYFEIRRDGQAIDPYPWLARR